MPVDERERARRRRLVEAHVAAENAHDIDAIMATFAPHAIGQTNGDVSTTAEAIRQGHVFFGMSHEPAHARSAVAITGARRSICTWVMRTSTTWPRRPAELSGLDKARC